MTSRSRTAWTVVITLLAGGGLSETARAQARQEAIDRGRAFLLAQQRADGRIAGRLDVLATARLTSALRAAGTEPEDLSEHLATAAAASGDAVEVAAALSASDDEGLVAALLGLEGPPGDFGSLLATAAAAQVLAERSPAAAARALDALTAADDGTVGDGRDRVLLTAAALLAFAAGDRDAEAAVAALEACRRDDGGFGDIEETALAVQALAAAGRPVDGSSVAWLTRALDQPVSPRTRAAVLQAGLAAGDPHDRFSAAALAMAAAVDPDGVFLGGRSNRDTAALLEALDPAADEDGRDAAARWLLRPLQDGAPTADSALRTLALAELAETDAPGVGRLLARQRPDGGCPARAGDQPDPLQEADDPLLDGSLADGVVLERLRGGVLDLHGRLVQKADRGLEVGRLVPRGPA